MKILFIGNSFSDDAGWRLYDVLSSIGETDSVVGILFIGGCPLSLHAENIKKDAAAYEYRKFNAGGFTNRPETTALYALNDEQWDVVTLQQCSGLSGVAESYNEDIDVVLNAVKASCPHARVYWHMTWAYDDDSTHAEFYRYDHSHKKMYNAIVAAVKSRILPFNRFDGVIPCGTAIENAREKGLTGLTRDGFHLSFGLGRYIASLTVAQFLTGKAAKCNLIPDDYPEIADNRAVALKCAQAAVSNPFEVTKPL